MILIVTYKEDYTADFLINKLNELGLAYFRLNTEDIEQHNYHITKDTNLSFEIDSYNTFTSVWYRRLKLPEINTDPYLNAYLATEYEFLFSNLLHSINAKKWMSLPDSIERAENKILQLRLASSLGFTIPDTIVTNRKDIVKNFSENYKDTGIIIKPLFSGRIEYPVETQLIYTSEVTLNQIESLDEFDLSPCIFQEKISKSYEIRVTVVGEKAFAARVNSQENEKTKIDWRKDKLAFTPYFLPKDIEKKCILLIQSLNLHFGAIDLIRSKNGTYVFLENNPNGQWAWVEMETAMPISKAIINFLYTDG